MQSHITCSHTSVTHRLHFDECDSCFLSFNFHDLPYDTYDDHGYHDDSAVRADEGDWGD